MTQEKKTVLVPKITASAEFALTQDQLREIICYHVNKYGISIKPNNINFRCYNNVLDAAKINFNLELTPVEEKPTATRITEETEVSVDIA